MLCAVDAQAPVAHCEPNKWPLIGAEHPAPPDEVALSGVCLSTRYA